MNYLDSVFGRPGHFADDVELASGYLDLPLPSTVTR